MKLRHGLQPGLALLIALSGCAGTPEGTDATGTSPTPPSEPTASPTTESMATTENGEAVSEPYSILDGEVSFRAALPWEPSIWGWDSGKGLLPSAGVPPAASRGPADMTTLLLNGDDQGVAYEQRVRVLADPRPIETSCRRGPAPADADALVRSIRSDPDLEATAPVAVSVGGTEALRTDVVAASGASICELAPAPWVVTETSLDRGHRMRLYLLDLPDGLSARILAIAISSPEASFERVLEAAAPIVESFEFATG